MPPFLMTTRRDVLAAGAAAIVASLAGMTVPKVYRFLPLLLYPTVVILAAWEGTRSRTS